ncbi:MAG: hypothetical protein COU90_04710 [Candidatus Ryanbacteria bacterium CG10_big_fil_rev_8_21_14_0_10_43_42]|uniref:Phospho-N-acetylmuramoyl-pentapeptide-transferase n=1 Tax=Candidatus Ryanbacteria bacterium CG10_big_fil_rev_8_21_14_0_10_43_42 TaxID=1974864 RepID=A0A2M8KW90_9BACT|nr:MAG: hypothetical protein COU90_04710 [Candidatus Ryanbacteria bacterium CG10_big_fil_rev_8_21_14_0_10_43_42]
MIETGNDLTLNIFKVLGLSGLSFFLAIALTPILTRYMYMYKLWKASSGKRDLTGEEAIVFNSLHNETHTPRVGGILIWGSVFVIAFTFWLLSTYTAIPFFEKLNFVSRSQTWILLFTLITASFLGLADDMLQIWASRKNRLTGGIDLWVRITIVTLIALVGAFWFYTKLDWRTLYFPGIGNIFIGIWYIPFFVLTMLATFSGSVIDGIDGLSGGVLASAFAAYSGIAFFQNQFDVATFAGVIVGAILAFLWFNIPPARFWMGESGMVGLTTTLTVIAFFTDSVLLLPIIALPLVLASGSDIIQIASRKIRGKKVFLVAPIQHHFEAKGWPSHKVTMRFWVMSVIFAIIGMALALIGR